jgi:hypothetical protein
MKNILIKDKVLKKLEIPLSILTKLEKKVAYSTNHNRMIEERKNELKRKNSNHRFYL